MRNFLNMRNKQEPLVIETREGGTIRVYFDSDSEDTFIEVWDPYRDDNSNGWTTLTLDPQAASKLKQAL